ncbi:MAG: divalent-cation tolerance protein CutA [Candidatus Aenigmarchaeota archaeon]|nr:divalent-cation tolerance protein CutA [Candidatus Aenigmarchaeota archaeon]
MKMVWIYITNPSEAVANKVAVHLIKKRLGVCVNIFPIESVYRWGGKITKEKEWVAIVKTLSSKRNIIEKELSKIHPYTIPCIAAIDVSINKKYGKWAEREIK